MHLAIETILCASDDSAEGVDYVKPWCRLQGYGPDDVRIFKKGGVACVIGKLALSPRSVLSTSA